MSSCVIELIDNEIRVGQSGHIILRSPGYALLDGDKIELGSAAASQARLHPRAAHNRYWKNLNQDPLQYPSPRARHNADLAFAHLLGIHEQAGKPEQAILAVPAIYTNEQLALLLGLIAASPFSAIGLVDNAIAAVAAVAGPGSYVHIDIHLHQAILTRIKVAEQVTRASVQLVDGVGMTTIFDNTAHLIADLFIKQARFDPQHHPETEQALYDQIPACLASLQKHQEVVLEIQYQQSQHQAKLAAPLLRQSLQSHYDKIANAIDAGDTCLLSPAAAQLPGFASLLNNAEAVDELCVLQACEKHAALIRSDEAALSYVTSLPANPTPLLAAKAATTVTKTPPRPAPADRETTHVLLEHKAYPLQQAALYLSATGDLAHAASAESHCAVRLLDDGVELKRTGELTVFVNGRQVQDTSAIGAGDIVSFAGSKTEYTFIHVGS